MFPLRRFGINYLITSMLWVLAGVVRGETLPSADYEVRETPIPRVTSFPLQQESLEPGSIVEQPTAAEMLGQEIGRPRERPTSDTGGGPLNGGPMGKRPPGVMYVVRWYPEATVRGGNSKLSFTDHEISANVPCWADGPHMVMVNAAVEHLLTTGQAMFPSGTPFPEQLWNIRLGVSHIYRFENGMMLTTRVNVGTTSDQPFRSIDEMNATLFGSLMVPAASKNAWLFSLMYNPTGELPFPIPGIAYVWRPAETFSMTIGLPFSIRWQPIEEIEWTAMYIPVRTVRTQVTWKAAESLSVFAGFEWANEAFFLADRTDREERLLNFEKRLRGGVMFQPTTNLTIDLSGGYAFDRFWFNGRRYQDRNDDRIDLGDGAFIGATLQLRY